MVMTLTVQEIAAKTAAELRAHGWTQECYVALPDDMDLGLPEDELPAVLAPLPKCLVGAQKTALYGTPWTDSTEETDEERAFYEAIFTKVRPITTRYGTLAYPEPSEGAITSWNDQRQNVDEVLAVLDEIAAS